MTENCMKKRYLIWQVKMYWKAAALRMYSVSYTHLVEKGFIGDVAIAEAAIPNCGISSFTGKEGSQAGADILKAFNQTMFEMEPASIG